MKPKELSAMTDKDLSEAYRRARHYLKLQMGTPVAPFDEESENAWYDEAEQAWLDVKRCHHQLVLRRGREWASQSLEKIMEDLHGKKE